MHGGKKGLDTTASLPPHALKREKILTGRACHIGIGRIPRSNPKDDRSKKSENVRIFFQQPFLDLPYPFFPRQFSIVALISFPSPPLSISAFLSRHEKRETDPFKKYSRRKGYKKERVVVAVDGARFLHLRLPMMLPRKKCTARYLSCGRTD